MADIYCDEPIIATYRGTRQYDDLDGANSYLDCYQGITYHVTEGERIVLETEHFYISLEVYGVTMSLKTCDIKEFEYPGEWLDPHIHSTDTEEIPWVDYESTLFVGERLLRVEKKEKEFLLQFDDFELIIVPHELNEKNFPDNSMDYKSYRYVCGAGRLITRPCSCGGAGELLLDFVADYMVRCKKCKKATWAQMNAKDAIEEWNDGHTPCDASKIIID